MTSGKDTASFFAHGNTKQFEFCYKLYPQVLKLKAEKRNKKPEELIRLDHWYQNELPKTIKQRGKDAHMVHEELVQTMKWKQSRGKFYPQLSYLVKVNTPRAVMQETKKAFRKLPNLEQAITALSNLKGVGTTMASALLAAAAPDSAPFMADECLMAIPEIEGIDYTTKEYLNFVQHIQTTVQRLNSERDSSSSWSPHRVELALWAHYVASDLDPNLLEDMPDGTNLAKVLSNGTTSTVTSTTMDNEADENSVSNDSVSQERIDNTTQTTTNTDDGTTPSSNQFEPSDESNLEPPSTPSANGKNNGNGVIDSLDESSSRSDEDSLEKPITPLIANDETNDSDTTLSSGKRSLQCESSEDQNSQPEIKKNRSD